MQVTRREAAAGIAGAILAGIPAVSEGRGMKNPFFAMDTCTKPRYPHSDTSIAAQLDLVKELGYAGLSWTEGDPVELRQAVEEARKRGLRIWAHYAGVVLEQDRLAWPARLLEEMDALRGHNAIVWLHVGGTAHPRGAAEGERVAAAGLRLLANEARVRRLRLALYPHAGDWLESTHNALRILRAVDRPEVGLSFNLCHALRVEGDSWIHRRLEDAGSRLFVVTLNGADAGTVNAGWDRLIQPLDSGTYDVAALLRTLRRIRFRGPIGLQGYGIPGDVRANLARSMAAWRRLSAAV